MGESHRFVLTKFNIRLSEHHRSELQLSEYFSDRKLMDESTYHMDPHSGSKWHRTRIWTSDANRKYILWRWPTLRDKRMFQNKNSYRERQKYNNPFPFSEQLKRKRYMRSRREPQNVDGQTSCKHFWICPELWEFRIEFECCVGGVGASKAHPAAYCVRLMNAYTRARHAVANKNCFCSRCSAIFCHCARSPCDRLKCNHLSKSMNGATKATIRRSIVFPIEWKKETCTPHAHWPFELYDSNSSIDSPVPFADYSVAAYSASPPWQ